MFKNFLFALTTLAAIAFSQAAHAANFTRFSCDPVQNTGARTYSQEIHCYATIARPALDTGAVLVELGVMANEPAKVRGVASNPIGWTRILRNVLNDAGNRIFDILGEVPLGGSSDYVMRVRVSGGCGTSTVIYANIANYYLVNVPSGPLTIHFPACPATPTPTATATPTFSPTRTPTATPSPTPTPGISANSLVQLSVAGIYDNGNGTYTAYFTYNNKTSSDITIQAGLNSTSQNFFSPSPANRGQTSVFKPGIQKGAISVVFDGNSLTYTVASPNSAPSSVTVTAQSQPRLALVEPLGQCSIDGAGTSFTAIMGYRNDNDFEIKLPIGALNQFSPGAVDRGQPISFFPGLNSGAFSVTSSEPLQWKLPGKSALLDSNLPTCSCPTVGGAEIRSSLDADALRLNELAKTSADLIASVGTGQAKTSATHSRKRSSENLSAIKSATIKIPSAIVSCPTAPVGCTTVDNGPAISALENQFDIGLNIVKRAVARAFFLKTGKTQRNTILVKQAKEVRDRGIATLKTYPRFSTACGN